MQRNEVEAIFQERKEKLLQGITPSTNPIAIIMGGQPACGKSFLLEIAKSDNIDKKFLSINGDLYREFHPEKAKLIKDPIKYPIETQIFSSVFTEKLIEEAIKSRYNIIIEGTMRNPDVPLKTAKMFKDAGFRVEAYIIAAPKEFTQLGLYNRYQEEVLSKGQGRLADIDSHNKAVNGLMKSANQLYSDKAVDKISIHTYLAKERIKELNSTCKCNRILINNLFKFFVWREVSKSFTRSIIEFIFNPLNLFVGYFTKVLTLWDILPDKPVGVFIGTTFP